MVNNKRIGVLHVIDKPGGFKQDDIALLQLLVSQLAIAIENARLVCRIKAEEVQARCLYELSKEFRVQDVKPLISLAAEKIAHVLPVSLVAIALRDGPGVGKIVAEAGMPVNWIGRSVQLSPGELRLRDLADTKEPLEELEADAASLGMQSQAAVIIGSDRDPLGKLWVWCDRRKAISASQARFLSLVANQLAIALQNTTLFERERRTAHRLQRFVELHERLVLLILKGAGIQGITESLAHHLNAGIVFYDAQWTRKAWARVAGEKLAELDASFLRAAEEGKAVALKYPYRVSRSAVLDQEVLIAPVHIERDTIGYLCILPEVTGQNDDFDSIIERTLPVYALEFLKEHITHEARQNAERDFVSALLGDRYSEKEVLERASGLGYDLFRPYVVGVADVALDASSYNNSPYLLQPSWLAEVKSLLRRHFPNSLAVLLHDQLVLFIPCRYDQGPNMADQVIIDMINEFVKQCEKITGTIYVGIGCIGQGVEQLRRSYREACFALKYIKRTRQKQQVVAFKDLGFYQALVDENAASSLSSFTRELIGPLLEMDRRKNTAYLKTLDRYLANGRSIKATSKALFCHANTVRYRLERIRQMLNFSLDNEEHIFNLQVALRMARFYYPELF